MNEKKKSKRFNYKQTVNLQKLNDLGFIRGEKIKFMEQALFGDPIMIVVRGCLFGLNKNVAKNIKVYLAD